MKTKNFDIIVIGAGSGGLNIAGFMNRAGFKTLLIEKSDRKIGGDCLNFGCVPSKSLINIAREIHIARKSKKFGLNIKGKIDFKRLKREIIRPREKMRKHENADYLRKKGLSIELGEAKFYDKESIVVNNKIFKARKIILATGSQPRKLKIPGIEKVKLLNNENIFDLEKLPKKFLFIGAGPIGMEIAQAFSHLGSQVVIISNSNQILPREDKKITKILQGQLEKEGIVFKLNSELIRFTSKNELLIKNKKSKKQEKIKFDRVFIAIGRELNFKKLSLEKANIKLTKNERGIVVDKYLKTTNKKVLLCGDVAGGPQFTHTTELQAKLILNNFFSPFKKKIDYSKIAWVTYVFPELATFGLNKQALKKSRIKYKILTDNFKEDDRAIIENYPDSISQIFISEKDKILGGSILAPNAGELIQELILAQNENLGLKNLLDKMYPYPTATRINRKMVADFLGKSLNKKITQKILKFLYH